LRQEISQAILELQESGKINQLKRKWWFEKNGGVCPKVVGSDNLLNHHLLN
jgi:hypothetical protein